MKELRKVQLCQLDLVLEVDRICKTNKIKYVLIGGTLLGAIRHKGFIPWDDDLDIGMLREDYCRFIDACEKENVINDKYYLQTWDNDSNYGHGFAKLRIKNTHFVEENAINTKAGDGIFIDVFPFDDGFSKKRDLIYNIKKFYFWSRMYLYGKGYFDSKSSFKKKIGIVSIKTLGLLFSSKFKKNCVKRITSKGDKKSKYITNYFGVYKEKDILLRKSFDNIITTCFEGYDLPIPECYDEDLRIIYGDYMTPPPENKRNNRHGILKIDFGNYEPYNKKYINEIGEKD